MLDTFTVSFFGHRNFHAHHHCRDKLEEMIRAWICKKEYVEFLVGRNGEFDQFVSSLVQHVKKAYYADNSSLVWVLPYQTADFVINQKEYEQYYDEIEICETASVAHFKAAIQIRNRSMVERSDLIVCYVACKKGGAYQTIQYAKKQGKEVVNLAEE